MIFGEVKTKYNILMIFSKIFRFLGLKYIKIVRPLRNLKICEISGLYKVYQVLQIKVLHTFDNANLLQPLTHHKLALSIGKTFKETEIKSKNNEINEKKAKVKRQKQQS